VRVIDVKLTVLLAVLTASCAAPTTPTGHATDAEIEFGLGDKADGFCDARALLCWPGRDSEALRRYFSAQDALLVGAGDDGENARRLLLALDDVAHKLEPAEVDALPALRREAASAGAQLTEDERISLVVAVHREAGGRVATGYLTAHAVALGASTRDSRADDGSSASSELPSVLTDPDVIDSLRELRGSGAFGFAYALLIEHTGVLDIDVNVWDEEFPFSEPREQRISRIIDRYTNLATRDEILVNLESLIPYAGIPLSIAHGAIAHFRHRLRMTIEIAAAYGIDIREGQNLLLVTGAVMSTLEIPELRGLFGGVFALPVLAKIVVRLGGVLDPRALLRRLSRHMINALLGRLSRKGAELVARATARRVGVGASRQILGYATLGLTMIADVVLTRAVTHGVGEHVDAMIRPWGSGMLTENGSVAADLEGAQCVAEMLGTAMSIDGEIEESEWQLLAAHLSRSIWTEGRWRPLADTATYAMQADAAARGAGRSWLGDCLEDRYWGEPRGDRMAVLSWLLTMFAVDGHLVPRELDAWEDAVDTLRGEGWFGDGDEIEELHLAAMRARIETTLVSADHLLDPGDAGALDELTPADVISGYSDADPAAATALRCAFDGC